MGNSLNNLINKKIANDETQPMLPKYDFTINADDNSRMVKPNIDPKLDTYISFATTH